MKLIYDSKYLEQSGNVECRFCHSTFKRNGPAIHNAGCMVGEQGYDYCDYIFGPNVVSRLKAKIRDSKNPNAVYEEISMEILRQQFPDLAK